MRKRRPNPLSMVEGAVRPRSPNRSRITTTTERQRTCSRARRSARSRIRPEHPTDHREPSVSAQFRLIADT